MKLCRLPLVLLIFFIFSTLPLTAEVCTPQFPMGNGWWGADAAYSIPLPDGRSVWIFGDTLIGDKRVVVDDEPRMVRNSIAISNCRDGKWAIDYIIRKDVLDKPRDFFEAKGPKWYWALDGFVNGKELWMTLLCLRSVPRLKTWDLGFETCGADLARVTGLDSDPQDWKVKIYPFVEDGMKAYPSSTAIVEGEYAYLFALYEEGSRPLVVTRIPLKNPDSDPRAKLEYLAKDDSWKPGFDPRNAKHVMKHGNTEMTIRYHEGRKQWLAVMNAPDLASDEIILRTAPALTGPWSDGKVIYRIPEMQKSDSAYDLDNTCYAGKEHPEFRDKDSILITYVCNTRAVKKLETKLDIYFPKVVKLQLPPATK